MNSHHAKLPPTQREIHFGANIELSQTQGLFSETHKMTCKSVALPEMR